MIIKFYKIDILKNCNMVLIRFRTGQNKSYKIELEPNSTISQAKENLSKEIGNNADHSKFKMLFKAKMLKDDQTIESLHLNANDFILVHTFLPKPIINYSPNTYPVNSEEAARIVEEVTSNRSTIPLNTFLGAAASGNPDDPSDRVFRRVLEINPRAIENIVALYQQKFPNIRDHLSEFITQLGLNPASFNLENVRNRTEPPLSQFAFDVLIVLASRELGIDLTPYTQSNRRNVPPPGMNEVEALLSQLSQSQSQQEQPQNQISPILAQFTPEEREAIQRLQQLGNFSLEYVAQIYVAAGKDGNIAANLLFGN